MEEDDAFGNGSKKRKSTQAAEKEPMVNDEFSYGASGDKNKGLKKRKGSKKSQTDSEKEPRLTPSDEDYPKDIPENAPFYEKFWTVELRAVMDQGFRRTCWTIASSRCLSARLLIEKRADPPLLLSSLHLLVGLFPKTDAKGGLKRLEDLQEFLKSMFIKETGTILEADCKCRDPFAEAKKRGLKGDTTSSKIPPPILCTNKGCQAKRLFKVRDLVILKNVDENQLILLLNQGPVAVTINVYEEFEKFKGNGIYTGPKDKNSAIVDNHMLILSGYGTYKKQHYWLGQNSAGLDWGHKGFVKILRQASMKKGEPSLITCILYPVLLGREAYN